MKTLILIFCLGLIIAGCKKGSVSPYQSQGVLTSVCALHLYAAAF
ncbi:MAG: hypothetical protein JWR54_398 [Mucilaginibacter sp.]|nr:hypothetical protein [Mucilaginibacter sp.]